MLHRLLILFHISLVACHLYSFNAGGLPMLRICQVLFLSISNCVYFMFVSVLIEVNEHKQYWLFFFFCSCWVWYLNCLNFCNWFYCIYNIWFKKILEQGIALIEFFFKLSAKNFFIKYFKLLILYFLFFFT